MPGAITPERWRQIVLDTADFMALWGVAAHRLGWSTLQLYGVDPLCPEGRTDCMGLCWLLDGRVIGALSPDKIAVRNRRAGVKHFYRQPEALGAVPLWDLA